MKKVIFYSYPKCSTCRRASKWLDQNNIKYQFKDIIKEPPTKKYLELALKQSSLDIKKIFNTRGKSFKLIDFDILDLTKKQIIELLFSVGKLIKKAIYIIKESKLLLGFNNSEYVSNFKKSFI